MSAGVSAAQSADAPYPEPLHGEGLTVRRWDEAAIAQAARWGQRGFPYHGFNLGHLSHPGRAALLLDAPGVSSPHRHFVAIADGFPVGRVSVNLEDPAGLYLWSVHVPPEQEGRGICRRMLAVLMRWLEESRPPTDFVLNSNAFAERAHRAYAALGFVTTDTLWHYDREIAEAWPRVSRAERETILPHVRQYAGRIEVRVHVMRRERGAKMALAPRESCGSS